MTLRISKPKDVAAGAIFLVIGSLAWLGAQDYPLGTATRMGPGYFPHWLGALLVLLGAITLLRGIGRAAPEPGEPRSITPLLLILAGIIGFTLLVDRAGLVAAILVLTGFACAPQLRQRPWEVALIGIMLAAFCVAVFINGFAMPLRAF
jgi:hypothetical protein